MASYEPLKPPRRDLDGRIDPVSVVEVLRVWVLPPGRVHDTCSRFDTPTRKEKARSAALGATNSSRDAPPPGAGVQVPGHLGQRRGERSLLSQREATRGRELVGRRSRSLSSGQPWTMA